MTGIQIERGEHEQEFVVVSNAAARDSRLSFRARGLHHHLLSLPPGWQVTMAQLAEDHPEGRDAIRAALNELVKLRYVIREKRQGADGRWTTAMTVYGKPQPETGNPSLAPPAETCISAGHAEDGFPGVGNPVAKNVKTVTKDGTKDGERASGVRSPGAARIQVLAKTPLRNARGQFARAPVA